MPPPRRLLSKAPQRQQHLNNRTFKAEGFQRYADVPLGIPGQLQRGWNKEPLLRTKDR